MEEIKNISASDFILLVTGHDMRISHNNAKALIEADRRGEFTDSPKPAKVVNVNIASLGTFHISSPKQSEGDIRKEIIKVLTKAINDAATTL